MRKDVLIELIKESLSGGDAPAEIRGKYDPRIIEKYLDTVYNDIVYQLYQQGEAKGGDFSALDNFGKAYKVEILKDEERNEFYSQLPINVVPLPDNTGIRQVSPYDNQELAYDIIDNNSMSVFSKLFNQVMRPVSVFYVELPRIYYRHLPVTKPKAIMIKAIPPFDGLGEQDEVFVPGGNNANMLNMVYDLMLKRNQTPRKDADNLNTKQI